MPICALLDKKKPHSRGLSGGLLAGFRANGVIMNNFATPCKLDWFQVAILTDFSHVQETASFLADSLCSVFSADAQPKRKGKNNYAVQIPVSVGSGKNAFPVGSVSYGGNTTSALGHHVQLLTTGDNAHTYYSTAPLPHNGYAQRIDYAYDFTGDYATIIALIDSLPDFSRIKKRVISECENGINATTTYYGSRESAYFIRIYEKGKQVGQRPDWIRFEIEVKPMKTSREFALWVYKQLFADAEQVLTRCKHALAALTAVFGLQGTATYHPRQEKPTTDAIRALTHMLTQYCSTIAALAETYDLDGLNALALSVHQLRQNDSQEIRDSVPEFIAEYLTKNSLPPRNSTAPLPPV